MVLKSIGLQEADNRKWVMRDKACMKAWYIATILVTVTAVLILAWKGYSWDRDIDSLIDRAQIAADREDMHEYLTQLKSNLEYHGLNEGHTALIFKNPRNDLALTYKAITRLIERLDEIKDIPRKETAYQVALDDIRGTIREIPNPSAWAVWVRYGWWLGLIVLVMWAGLLFSYEIWDFFYFTLARGLFHR